MWHVIGFCPLKLAGEEHCNLCGLAHYGVARSCPHIRSETQVRDMLETLRNSTEPRHLIDLATRYLQGVKGSIVQDKKRKEEKQTARLALAHQDNSVLPLTLPLQPGSSQAAFGSTPHFRPLLPAQQYGTSSTAPTTAGRNQYPPQRSHPNYPPEGVQYNPPPRLVNGIIPNTQVPSLMPNKRVSTMTTNPSGASPMTWVPIPAAQLGRTSHTEQRQGSQAQDSARSMN